MRSLILFLTVTASGWATACPDFSGRYSCKEQENGQAVTSELTVVQTPNTIALTDANGIQTYNLKESTIIPAMGVPVTFKVMCTKNEMVIQGKASFVEMIVVTMTLKKSATGFYGSTVNQIATLASGECIKK